MDRTIIHLNVADFAVAVERGLDRRLSSWPVIIAPTAAARAVVYDMSEEAYAGGVRKGMSLRRALGRIPEARVLPPRPHCYERAMAALLRKALPYSPLIEPGDADGHLFVDVTGTSRLFGPAVDVAWRMRRQIRSDLGLDPIWSVAPNKLVAKVATRLVKPLGEYIVGAGDEEAFLEPLPLFLLPGIDRSDMRQFLDFNLTHVHQLKRLQPAHLQVAFGARAPFIHDTLRGVDPSPVLPAGDQPPRICREHTFDEDTNDTAIVESVLYRLVEQAGRALRHQRRSARRMAVTLDYTDGVRRVRQRRLNPATANDTALFTAAQTALRLAHTRRLRVRYLRLVCDRLVYPPAQLPLFAPERDAVLHSQRLISAMDRIRRRFGVDAVRVGRTLAAS